MRFNSLLSCIVTETRGHLHSVQTVIGFNSLLSGLVTETCALSCKLPGRFVSTACSVAY